MKKKKMRRRRWWRRWRSMGQDSRFKGGCFTFLTSLLVPESKHQCLSRYCTLQATLNVVCLYVLNVLLHCKLDCLPILAVTACELNQWRLTLAFLGLSPLYSRSCGAVISEAGKRWLFSDWWMNLLNNSFCLEVLETCKVLRIYNQKSEINLEDLFCLGSFQAGRDCISLEDMGIFRNASSNPHLMWNWPAESTLLMGQILDSMYQLGTWAEKIVCFLYPDLILLSIATAAGIALES